MFLGLCRLLLKWHLFRLVGTPTDRKVFGWWRHQPIGKMASFSVGGDTNR